MTPEKQSRWIRFVELFLLWLGGRSVFNVVLYQMDPNFRAANDGGFGPFLVIAEALLAFLAFGAAVAIFVRYRHALMMGTAALALYTGLSVAGIMQLSSNLPAAREAYKASREARGVPLSDERLDAMFSPVMIPFLWLTAAALCIPPYAILVWRKHELEPVDDEDE
jgi:hypothetical protein